MVQREHASRPETSPAIGGMYAFKKGVAGWWNKGTSLGCLAGSRKLSGAHKFFRSQNFLHVFCKTTFEPSFNSP